MPADPDRYDSVLLRMPKELGARVRQTAEDERRPLSWVMRELLEDGLKARSGAQAE